MIKDFRQFENDTDLLRDLDSIGIEQHKGWLVCWHEVYDNEGGSGMFAVVAKNAGEAAALILAEKGIEDEDDLAAAKKHDNVAEALEDVISDIIGWSGRFDIAKTYDGLEPRKYEDYAYELDWTNPLMAMKELRSIFTNVDSVLDNK